MSNQTESYAESGLCEQATILGVCDLPYFTKDFGGDFGTLEEGNSIFAGNDTKLVLVGLGEEVGECAFFFGREIKEGLV